MALIVRYSFNESKGDRINDSSANKLHITLKESTGEFEYLKPDRELDENHTALKFSGKELLKRENHDVLNPTNVTVMAWVYYRDPYKNSEPDPNYKGLEKESRLEILEKWLCYWINIKTKYDIHGDVRPEDERGKIRFGFGPGGGYRVVDSKQQLTAEEWHHVAGTLDGTSLRVFIDGIEDKCKPLNVGVDGTIPKNDHPLIIGAMMTDKKVEAFFYGMIHDVIIYDKALEADEINKVKDSYPPPTPGSPSAPTGFRIVRSKPY